MCASFFSAPSNLPANRPYTGLSFCQSFRQPSRFCGMAPPSATMFVQSGLRQLSTSDGSVEKSAPRKAAYRVRVIPAPRFFPMVSPPEKALRDAPVPARKRGGKLRRRAVVHLQHRAVVQHEIPAAAAAAAT